MQYKLLIFDLDGTVLDTLQDLYRSMNHALTQNGYPTRSLAEIRAFVGNGLQKLVERSLPAGEMPDKVQKVLADLKEHYAVHCKDNTRPYAGIHQLLWAARGRGQRTAVVSNKADFAVQELVAEFFPGMFDAAVGEQPGMRKKPAPDGVRKVLKELNIPKRDAVYIGDSEVDLATADNAGLDSILVTWGFRDREQLEDLGVRRIVSTPAEILQMV